MNRSANIFVESNVCVAEADIFVVTDESDVTSRRRNLLRQLLAEGEGNNLKCPTYSWRTLVAGDEQPYQPHGKST